MVHNVRRRASRGDIRSGEEEPKADDQRGDLQAEVAGDGVRRVGVVRIDAERAIQASDLEACGAGTERLLLKTRSAALWDEPEFRPDFVALTSEAAGWLVQQGVRLVGIDYLSIDPYDAHPQAAHLMLLGAGVVVVEGLDLRRVPPGDYDLACLPIKLRGADGAPARVVLRSID